MKRYKIVVAYDGTDYHGWQVQPSDKTVASTLHKSFENAFSKKVSIVGASRTDSGVHALGQVALSVCDLKISPLKVKNAWNNCLPSSIMIRSIAEVDSDFHIFADVVSKTYYYHLFLARPLPFVARFGWFWKFIDQVDLEKFEKAMNCFVGEHDFRSFCKNEKDKSTVRKIDSIKVKKIDRFKAVQFKTVQFKTVQIVVKGKGFLRYQIRRMIGAALDVSRKKNLYVDFIDYQLKNPSDQQEFTRAEGCGLCLRKIIYKKR